MVVELQAGGRAWPDVRQRGQAIQVVLGPLGPTAPPAELGPGGDVAKSRRPIPGGAQVPFHVGVVGKEFAVGTEGDVIRVAKPARHEFHKTAISIGAKNRAAGGGDAHRVATGVFMPRLDQIAFVPVAIGTARPGTHTNAGVVAQNHVQEAIGPQPHGVRAVFTLRSADRHQVGDLFGHAVAVGVAEPVQPDALGPITDDKHACAQRQDALRVGDLVAKHVDRVVRTIVVAIGQQEQRPILARGQDVPPRVECHGDQRTDFLVAHQPFDGELFGNLKPGSLAVEDNFVTPGQSGTQLAIAGRSDPLAFRKRRSGPVLIAPHAGLPRFVRGVARKRATRLFDQHSRHQPGRALVDVGHLDGDRVDAFLELLGDVVDFQLPPVGALAHGLAVDEQLKLVVGGDLDFAHLRGAELERLAKIAVAHGHFVFGVGGRPDPLGVAVILFGNVFDEGFRAAGQRCPTTENQYTDPAHTDSNGLHGTPRNPLYVAWNP